jgi:hypothetical protein
MCALETKKHFASTFTNRLTSCDHATSRIVHREQTRACLSHQPLALRVSDYQTISVHARGLAMRTDAETFIVIKMRAQIYRRVQTLQLASHEMPGESRPPSAHLPIMCEIFAKITKRGPFCCFVVEIERNRAARRAVCGRALGMGKLVDLFHKFVEFLADVVKFLIVKSRVI